MGWFAPIRTIFSMPRTIRPVLSDLAVRIDLAPQNRRKTQEKRSLTSEGDGDRTKILVKGCFMGDLPSVSSQIGQKLVKSWG